MQLCKAWVGLQVDLGLPRRCQLDFLSLFSGRADFVYSKVLAKAWIRLGFRKRRSGLT